MASSFKKTKVELGLLNENGRKEEYVTLFIDMQKLITTT